MTTQDPQLQALANRLSSLELVMFQRLKAPEVVKSLNNIVGALSNQVKVSFGPDTQLSLKLSASNARILLQLLGVTMERMNLMRFQELEQKEKENVTRLNLKLTSEQPTNPTNQPNKEA